MKEIKLKPTIEQAKTLRKIMSTMYEKTATKAIFRVLSNHLVLQEQLELARSNIRGYKEIIEMINQRDKLNEDIEAIISALKGDNEQ